MGKAPQKKGRHEHGSKKKHEEIYVSKAKAIHMLQTTQTDFRKLCILKGIYPQLPDKVKGLQQGKMYFYAKDIRFLVHEPTLNKYRELKTFISRLKKAKDLDEKEHENALMKYARPNFTYDHLIKERYPTFYAALEDLDDCLTLLFMLSKLPPQDDLQRREIENAAKLCKEFTTFVAKEKCLSKVFLSVKGIYYQAVILGKKVTWLVPYDFPQIVPLQVDFKVFKTFLTLYDTLMTFVNFKLFHMMGQSYPPIQTDSLNTVDSYILSLPEPETKKQNLTNQQKEIQSESEKRINSLNLEKIIKNQKKQGKEISQEEEEEEDSEDEKEDQSNEKVKETIDPFTQGEKVEKHLFKSFTFFISRECPKASIEFAIKSQGGHVSTEETDEKITHHVLDRPTIKNKKVREYIQPQWIYDCINNQILLPVHKYEPGVKLPPHLSPFVEYDENQYVPEYQQEISILKKEKEIETEDGEENIQDTDEEEMEEMYQRELDAERKGISAETLKEELKQEKKEKLREGVMTMRKKLSKKEQQEEDEKKLKETMMSRKVKNMYQGKVKADKKKKDIAENLKRKRELIKEKKAQNQDEQPEPKLKKKK
jgi:pescadillo